MALPTKADVRKNIAGIIGRLDPEKRRQFEAAIRKHFLALPEFQRAGRVMLFASMPDEVDTLKIIDAALGMGKEVYLPKVARRPRRMLICCIHGLDDLHPGAYGIPEPGSSETILPAGLDLVLVPGRAFDCRGNRLGRGGGFYDRFLTHPGLHADIFGIAFNCQILAFLPHDIGDVPVRHVVTESGIIGRPAATRGIFPRPPGT